MPSNLYEALGLGTSGLVNMKNLQSIATSDKRRKSLVFLSC